MRIGFFVKTRRNISSIIKIRMFRYDGVVRDEQSPLTGYDRIFVQHGEEGTIHIIRSGVGGNTVVRAMALRQDFTGILPSGTHSDYILMMFGT